jgi:hypothetical protein
MKRSGTAKFPHSVQLFKFCQKVMMHQRNGKVRDQEVGAIQSLGLQSLEARREECEVCVCASEVSGSHAG